MIDTLGKDLAWFLEHRHEVFPVTREKVFLAHSSTSPLPAPVGAILEEYARRHVSQWQNEFEWNKEALAGYLAGQPLPELEVPPSADPHFSIRYEVARALACSPDEVALTPNTVLGVGMLAESLPWRKGDRVLTVLHDFPANLQPWRNLRRLGVKIDVVKPDKNHRVTWERIERKLKKRTRLVTLSAVHYLTGYRAPLWEIGPALRERGILCHADSIQALGALPVELGWVDFVTAGGQKWLLSPKGSGLLAIRKGHLPSLNPTPRGWLCAANKFEYVHINDELDPTARRFEGGTTTLPCLLGMREAFRTVFNVLGWETIAARIQMLHDCTVETGAKLGWKPLCNPADPAEKSGIISFPVQEADAELRSRRLIEEKRIFLTVRPDALDRPCVRFSPQFYNTPEEIELAFAALRERFTPCG